MHFLRDWTNFSASMLIPTPRMIDAFVRELPLGVAVDVKAMRRALAATRETTPCP